MTTTSTPKKYFENLNVGDYVHSNDNVYFVTKVTPTQYTLQNYKTEAIVRASRTNHKIIGSHTYLNVLVGSPEEFVSAREVQRNAESAAKAARVAAEKARVAAELEEVKAANKGIFAASYNVAFPDAFPEVMKITVNIKSGKQAVMLFVPTPCDIRDEETDWELTTGYALEHLSIYYYEHDRLQVSNCSTVRGKDLRSVVFEALRIFCWNSR